MQSAKVLAVYRVSPLLRVLEAEDGTVMGLPSRSCTMAALA
jgi:hypothetical protein